MEQLNQSDFHVSHFIIIGLSGFEDWPSRIILFIFFLLTYTMTLLLNMVFLLIIKQNDHLHSPMYLLICNLALLDMCLPSVTVPRIMHELLWKDRLIGFISCVTQMGFFIYLNVTECILLAVMAYDRYQAICKPLHYHTAMTNRHVARLIIFCWIPGTLIGFHHVWVVLSLQFCGPNKIFDYFCDYMSVIILSCSNVTTYSFATVASALTIMILVICFIFFSYMKILISVSKVASTRGRQKAFSTCASHLTVIALFLFVEGGVLISSQIRGSSFNIAIIAGVFQNIFPPLMNPIIYCLKTKEIRITVIKLVKRNELDK
ncbi:olfactory receptor 24-like [Protopterus annectens]|uniref:olfactory receptor 24-like n=1 Tax=Protopterus annectens TaxID=7888 RepID=UPI001CFC140A|nr:olfactory receptor 24-like [Protopterus annectens]